MAESGSGAKLSLTVKLPLLIEGLLVLAVVVYSSISYLAVRRSALGVAGNRVGSVTEQLALALHQSASQLITATRQAADSGIVTGFLTAPSPRNRAAVAALLHRGPASGSQMTAAQLVDAGGRTVLTTGDTTVLRAVVAAAAELIQGLTVRDSGVIGRFMVVRDSVIYASAAPSISRGRLLGYLVVWRHLTATPQARRTTSQIIGTGAHLYLGNAADNVWSDLSEPVAAPPVSVSGNTGVLHYARSAPEGGAMIATGRAVPSTPWVVLVEFPTAAVRC